jgi:glutaminase
MRLLIIICGIAMAIGMPPTNSAILDPITQTLAIEYQKYRHDNAGKTASYIPELAKADPHLFAIVVITTKGKMYSLGDANIPFAIESISKPFVYALALQDNGEEMVTNLVGLNATGYPFNSIKALEERPDHLQNPLVNAGAIMVTSLIKGADTTDKWRRTLTFFSQLSDGKLFLGLPVYQSEMNTNRRNQALTHLLHSYGMLKTDPKDTLERYTKACSIMVTAKQLAIMGATLANKGVNPLTQQPIIAPQYVGNVLAEMTVNGLYENSGTWWVKVGLPAKSGVSGGLLAIVPGKMAIVVFSPALDKAGNSVRGQAVIKELSQRWKLHLLQQ